MTINLSAPELTELRPRIVVIGVGGAGGNAVNNMIKSGLEGVEFIVANTDAQSLSLSVADRRIQLGSSITQGLGCGARPEVGRAAAEESIDQVLDHMSGTHMAFIAAGMGGEVPADVATARALKPLSELIPMLEPLVRERGRLVLYKGPGVVDEWAAAESVRGPWEKTEEESFELPFSKVSRKIWVLTVPRGTTG